MEQSEYKDKHFHIVIIYWKDSGKIYGVECVDKAKWTDEQVDDRVREINASDGPFVRKIVPVGKELSQAIFFLARERARDKQSYADRVQELINNISILRDDVAETFESIKEEIKSEKSNNNNKQ